MTRRDGPLGMAGLITAPTNGRLMTPLNLSDPESFPQFPVPNATLRHSGQTSICRSDGLHCIQYMRLKREVDIVVVECR